MADQAAETTAPDSGNKKVKRFRSPPYPFIALSKVIGRAKELHEKALHHQVGLKVLADAWGYGTKSSGLNQTIAALKQFGLLTDQGSGPKRQFQLTDQAIRIIRDPDPESIKRKKVIKKAALAPKIHNELWSIYGDSEISDIVLKTYLTLDRTEKDEAPYSATAADELIEEYKETISFAGLSKSDTVSLEEGDKGVDQAPDAHRRTEPKQYGGAHVGDLIQWESEGELKFESPCRVRAVRDHEGHEWVFIEGSETGILMTQVIVEEKGNETGKTDAMRPPVLPEVPTALGARKEVTSLDEGNATLIWPQEISADSYHDLEAWLNSILHKARRRAGVPEKEVKPED